MTKLKNEFLKFEKSAYSFMEELKNLLPNIRIIHSNEYKRAIILISCVKNLMHCVRKEIEEVEKKIKQK